MNFDMPETAAKNTLVYRIFNKEYWEQKAKNTIIDILIKYQRTEKIKSR